MATPLQPEIRDDALFEALLRQGCSAEKAARIAHIDIIETVTTGFIGRGALDKEELIETARKG